MMATRAEPSDPPGQITLRAMSWTDIERVEQIEQRLFPVDGWTTATWWNELAGRPRRDYLVATLDGSIVGYAGADHAGDLSDVMTIGVDPDAQGLGLGRRLLGELESRARARGAGALILEVRADNAGALGLYRSSGFRVIQTRRRYYQPGDVDALVMRKILGAPTEMAHPATNMTDDRHG